MIERTTAKNAVPVREVIEGLRTWQTTHSPFDRATRLNLFQFVIEEGKGGALVPLGSGGSMVGGEISLGTLVQLPAITMKPHALKQYLTRLEYPPKLYERLPAKLNIFNLNWLQQHGGYEKGVQFRVQDGNEMRALMSQYYQPMDTLEVLTMAEPLLADGLVRWYFDDDLTFHMSVSFPSTATELKVGDVVEQGIHFSNSEVGVRSVTIAAYVYRLRCKNGAIGGGDGDVFRFRHVGSGDRLREMVTAAIESTKLEATRILAQFKDALTVAIDQPFEYLEKQFKERNLTQEQLKASLDALMGEPEKGNLFGISQSVSAAAQRFEGEQSYELQRAAVQISGQR